MKYFVRYQDDGAMGGCGQSCSISDPLNQMHVFENEDDAKAFIKRVREDKPTRKNQRITGIWTENEIIKHVGESY